MINAPARFTQPQTIAGYSSATVFGWAPPPTWSDIMRETLKAPRVQSMMLQNMPLLAAVAWKSGGRK